MTESTATPHRRGLSTDAILALALLLLLGAIALRNLLPTPVATPITAVFGPYVSAIEYAIVGIVMALSIYLTLATGLLSLANAGFMAIGAYTGALLTIHRGWPVWACVMSALLLGAIIGYLFGRPVLRLRDVYLAIATLGFGEIVRILAINGNTIAAWLLRRDPSTVAIFSGAEILRIPPPRRVETWHLVLYLALVLYFVIVLRRSHWGRTLASIRQDEAAAGAMGINVVRYKTFVFTAGAAIAAGAGVFHGMLVRGVDPSSYGFAAAVNTLAGVVLGGVATWVGPVVGASILSMLPEVLRRLDVGRLLSVQPEILYGILNGVILMLAIIYLPRGLADPVFWNRLFGRRRKATPLVSTTALTTEEREPATEIQHERAE